MQEKRFWRKCPNCSKELGYIQKSDFNRASLKNSLCNICSRIGKPKNKRKYWRKCPNCSKELGYTLKKDMRKLELAGGLCISCSKSGERNPSFGKTPSIKTIQKISAAQKGEKSNNFGKKQSIEIRRKISEAQKGEKNHNWHGGVSILNILVRGASKYKKWRIVVLKKGNFICKYCGNLDNLNAHHIVPFVKLLNNAISIDIPYNDYEKALLYTPLWDISGGIVLCTTCHQEVHRKENKHIKYGQIQKISEAQKGEKGKYNIKQI